MTESKNSETAKRYWLILSYRSNIDGSACAQHIDDRLPFFDAQGITPVLLTGPVGKRSVRWLHFRCPSIAPSGIRFELRHFLQKRLRKRWQFKLVETLLLLPVLPFYLLEKIIINIESEWSWFFLASIRGYFLCRRYRPEAIYSTGGSASAHIAGSMLRRVTAVPWLAETQDPLVHDQGWRRGKRVLAGYKWLERHICRNADSFIFLTRAARDNMAARTAMPGCGKVIYPGAAPDVFKGGLYKKGEHCHFAHFGTLNGTRNLMVFLQALRLLIDEGRVEPDIVRVDVYGTIDAGTEKTICDLKLDSLVTDHGFIPRKEALLAMQKTDCLVLVQNTIFFSTETIPSKVYEYLLSGRPTLGLIYENEELHAMLVESGNFPVPAVDVEAVAGGVEKIIELFGSNQLASWLKYDDLTVAKAVDELIALGTKSAKSYS
jgi:hypothetical protein